MSKSVCVQADGSMLQSSDQMDRILREELGFSHATSTPMMCIWPIYSKGRGNFMDERDGPPWRSLSLMGLAKMEQVAAEICQKVCVTDLSEGVAVLQRWKPSPGSKPLTNMWARAEVEQVVRIPPAEELMR